MYVQIVICYCPRWYLNDCTEHGAAIYGAVCVCVRMRYEYTVKYMLNRTNLQCANDIVFIHIPAFLFLFFFCVIFIVFEIYLFLHAAAMYGVCVCESC